MKYYIIFFCAIFFFSNRINTLYAQDNIGVNFIFMTWHFGGDNMAFLQPNRLDEKATFVLNWGGVLHYERFLYKRKLSIKLASGAYSDCAKLFAGHTHLAFRWNFLNSNKHDLRLGFGPTYVYRQSWYRFPGYIQEIPYFKTRGNWQTTFVWYAGEIEYDYKLTNKFNIGLHVIPGVPYFSVFGIGVRY